MSNTIYNVPTFNSASTNNFVVIPSTSSVVAWNGSVLQVYNTGSYGTLDVNSLVTQTGGGSGGDPNASYLVLSLTSSLSNERVLTAGPGITFNDSGANGILAISASLLAGTNITINQVGTSYAISSSATGGSGGDPNASYLVLGLTSSLSNERVLTAGPGITFNDSGANGILAISASLLAGTNITINQVGTSYAISSSATGGSGADSAASYIVVANTSSLTNERALTSGPGIVITDNGANSTIAISASLLAGPNITINQVGSSYAITGAASSSGTGSVSLPEIWSPVRYYPSRSLALDTNAGSPFTLGVKFYFTDQRTITGIRMYTNFADTFIVTLWAPDNSRIVSLPITASGAGTYSATLTSSYTVPTSFLYQDYVISQYTLSGQYNYATPIITTDWLMGTYLFTNQYGYYSTTNSYPSLASGYATPIEPIMTSVTRSLV